MSDKFKKRKNKKKTELRTYFIACEFKPDGDLWSILDNFAYDVEPAFIFGSLGVISYEPESYAIIDINENSPPLMGYICTITEPNTVLLLDKIKGHYGKESFNLHDKVKVKAYTDVESSVNAWAYILSEKVMENYESLEAIEFGIWQEDEKQIQLLEEIGESF